MVAKEWAEKSKYNSFNSYKGLTWMDSHYTPIAKWFKGETSELPAPIECSLDPSHLCNFACGHCNAQRYLAIHPEEVPKGSKLMPREHLETLMSFMADWGVRGVCIGGGGEPLMNRAVWNLPSYIAKRGMKPSFATNGSLIDQAIAEEMMYCRWVGVSPDSGTKETFDRVHGVDMFEQVINNMRMLVKTKERTGSKIDIAYKFLIRPDNWQDLYTAAKLAKDIGVRDFHARPVDLQRKDYDSAIQLNYDMDRIHEQFAQCHELEDNKFRVFTIMHKYSPEFKVEHNFKKCVSSSLMTQCCADGNVYVCADHRIEPRFKLCSHNPNPGEIIKYWGSDEHRRLLTSIDIDKECARCTYGTFAQQIEELAMGSKGEDPMCLDFP